MFKDYQTLGLSVNATKEEVKKKFNCLAKQVHPDKKNYQVQIAHEKFINIRKAYDNINKNFKELEHIENEEKMIMKTKLWYKEKQKKLKQEKIQQQRNKEHKKKKYQQAKEEMVRQQQIINEIFNNTTASPDSIDKFKYKKKYKKNTRNSKCVNEWNILFKKINTDVK